MTDRLSEILDTKRAEVARQKQRTSPSELGERARMAARPRRFADALRRSGEIRVIAEVKFASPAAGTLRETHDPAEVARGYVGAGASTVSVLCDSVYFGGGWDDLEAVRSAVDVPVLAKEFVVDPWQVVRARAGGADAVLLIVRALPDEDIAGLLRATRSMGMEAVVEAADEAELDRALALGATVVGVNCRDLRTLQMDEGTFARLLPRVPAGVVAIAMSGVSSGLALRALGQTRADAVLVGGALMRTPDPGATLRSWIEEAHRA